MIECANDEFQCYDGVKCLQWSYRCDRIAHCHDNSDEADCAGTVSYSIQQSNTLIRDASSIQALIYTTVNIDRYY